jgi:hypothetical protein
MLEGIRQPISRKAAWSSATAFGRVGITLGKCGCIFSRAPLQLRAEIHRFSRNEPALPIPCRPGFL